MDIQKERELFELSFKETDFSKMNLVNCFCFITDRYVWDEVQAAWEMWQTAIARMEVRINTLDEMLLNQGEALAQAKAQAVPEGFVLVPKEPTEAMIQRGTKANSECLNENAPLGERLFRHPALQVYQAMVNGSGE